MDYDRMLDDDPNEEFYYNDDKFPHKKLIAGYISLENALVRLNKGEYYVLVKTNGEEELPLGYVPLDSKIETEEPMATIAPNMNFQVLCRKGKIQMITQLFSDENGPNYLLGPGPETITLSQLITEQLEAYKKNKSSRTR